MFVFQRRPLINHLPMRDSLHSRKSLAARRPSVQASLVLAWCLACAALVVWRLPSAEYTAQQLLLFYLQPLLPVALLLWLWTLNVRGFARLAMEYEACFSARDRKLLPTGEQLVRLNVAVTVLLVAYTTSFSVLAAVRMYRVCELLPVALYGGLLLLLVAPTDAASRPSRLFFANTLRRVILPFQEVSWADFLLADMLCSLSWTTFTLSQALCSVATGPSLRSLLVPDHAPSPVCSPLAPPMLVGLCLPYILRFIQCCIVYRTTGHVSQLFNALKYCTAFPALVLAAQEHEHHVRHQPFPMARAWLAAQVLNTLYSTYWDIEFDWDMPWLAKAGARRIGPLRLPALRPDALFSGGWYAWLVFSNLALRLTWTHRLLGDLESHTIVALASGALEVWRRHQWAYVRVETELRKVRAKQKVDPLEAPLLNSGGGSGGGSSGGAGPEERVSVLVQSRA